MRARELRMFTPLPCHVSNVMCHVSCVMCHVSGVTYFFLQIVKLGGGGSVAGQGGSCVSGTPCTAGKLF